MSYEEQKLQINDVAACGMDAIHSLDLQGGVR